MGLPLITCPPFGGCGDPGAPIEYGALFDGAGYGYRTPSVTGSRRLMCASFWIKRTDISSTGTLFGYTEIQSSDSDYLYVPLQANDGIRVDTHTGTSSDGRVETKAVYRDPAAHSHFHIAFDMDNPTAADRVIIKKDGVREELDTLTAMELAADIWANVAGIPFHVGVNAGYGGTDNYLKAILSEFAWFDGVIPDVSEFGYFNAQGVWVPKAFAGKGGGVAVYGTNGFHLDFADDTDIFKDVSGNGNHLTLVGDVTRVTDTPTNDLSVLSSVDPDSAGTLSEGNLKYYVPVNTVDDITPSTLMTDQVGKFAAKASVDYPQTGVGFVLQDGRHCFYYIATGTITVQWDTAQTGLPTGLADFEMLIDHDAQQLRFKRNGAFVGSPVDIPQNQGVRFAIRGASSGDPGGGTWDFGQNGYIPSESGFNVLAAPTYECPDILNPDDYFTIRLSTGGADVTDLPWDPTVHKTLVVSKRRDTTGAWRIVDTIRGANKYWAPDPSVGSVEGTDATGIEAFTSGGIQVGASGDYQGSRIDYFWRASPTAGFDIVEVNHVNGTPTTVAHNAGGPIHYAWVPNMDGGNVRVFHHKLPAGGYYLLNATSAAGSDSGWFSSTAVDLTLGASMPSGRYVIPVWTTRPQFSCFVEWTGTGLVDGGYIPTDFAPRLFIPARKTGTFNRCLLDWDRSGVNPCTKYFNMESNSGEGASGRDTDFNSSSVKVRSTAGDINPSAGMVGAFWGRTAGKFARSS